MQNELLLLLLEKFHGGIWPNLSGSLISFRDETCHPCPAWHLRCCPCSSLRASGQLRLANKYETSECHSNQACFMAHRFLPFGIGELPWFPIWLNNAGRKKWLWHIWQEDLLPCFGLLSHANHRSPGHTHSMLSHFRICSLRQLYLYAKPLEVKVTTPLILCLLFQLSIGNLSAWNLKSLWPSTLSFLSVKWMKSHFLTFHILFEHRKMLILNLFNYSIK